MAEFTDDVKAFLDNAKAKAADGLTWSEFGQLLVELLHVAVRLADTLSVPGPERKAIVMTAAAALFDLVADKCVPVVLWPIWTFCRGPVRALVLALASGAVEALLPLARSTAP